MKRTLQEMIDEIEIYKNKMFPGTEMSVLGYAGKNDKNQVLVECSSKSRGVFTALWSEVKRGKVKGTLRGESRIKRNDYKIRGEVLTVYFNSGQSFVCDASDLDIVQNHTWYLNKNGYARSSDGQYFHRQIIDIPEGYIVDHINGNKLDNRKCNLRLCRHIDNSHNMKNFSTNTSGHTGVYKQKNGRYTSTIVVNYNKIHLGVFDSFEEACEAYDLAKTKYHIVEEVVLNDGLTRTDRRN